MNNITPLSEKVYLIDRWEGCDIDDMKSVADKEDIKQALKAIENKSIKYPNQGTFIEKERYVAWNDIVKIVGRSLADD